MWKVHFSSALFGLSFTKKDLLLKGNNYELSVSQTLKSNLLLISFSFFQSVALLQIYLFVHLHGTARCQYCPTCSNKQDACAEQNGVLAAVDASNPDTQASQHQKDGAENWE